VIRLTQWNDEVDKGLSRALPDAVIRGIVAAECRAGISQVWECADDAHHAFVVTRLDANPTEWVVVAYEGSGMHIFGPLFLRAARERNIPLRAHVTSEVVERLLRRLGLRREEVILRARWAA
jgi:hypothetical protein